MKDGACGHRGLIATVSALKNLPLSKKGSSAVPALGANKAIGPALLEKITPASSFSTEALLELEKSTTGT